MPWRGKSDLLRRLFGLYSAAEVVVHPANCLANLLGVIEVPGDRSLHLMPLAAARFGRDVQSGEASVLRERPAPGTSLAGQGVSGLDADGDLPGACLSHVRRSALQPGTACQVRSAAGITIASARMALLGIVQIYKESG